LLVLSLFLGEGFLGSGDFTMKSRFPPPDAFDFDLFFSFSAGGGVIFPRCFFTKRDPLWLRRGIFSPINPHTSSVRLTKEEGPPFFTLLVFPRNDSFPPERWSADSGDGAFFPTSRLVVFFFLSSPIATGLPSANF